MAVNTTIPLRERQECYKQIMARYNEQQMHDMWVWADKWSDGDYHWPDDVPALFMAIDPDGRVYAFPTRPTFEDNEWQPAEMPAGSGNTPYVLIHELNELTAELLPDSWRSFTRSPGLYSSKAWIQWPTSFQILIARFLGVELDGCELVDPREWWKYPRLREMKHGK